MTTLKMTLPTSSPLPAGFLPRTRSLQALALLAFGLVPGFAALPSASGATKPRPDLPPEIVQSAAGTIEIGTLGGVPYRMDVPAAWNHGLVVFYHGYSEAPWVYRASDGLGDQLQPAFDRGFAVIQSGYSTPGWALAEAYPETEALRQLFTRRYPQRAAGKNGSQPETIVAGASMGGALVVATLELNPKVYAGGLDLCGSVGPTDLAFNRRFAWRAAFDFYFPGVMPPLVPSPADYVETHALRVRVEEALKSNPAAGAAMRNLLALRTDHEVAGDLVYFTYVIADMQRRAGGNPFDNRNYLYSGTNPQSTASDNALNDGVRRYAADPVARGYLMEHYTPSGRLTRPMLALHTTFDPLVPPATLSVYNEQVAITGMSDNLVQQYVRHDGHCAFTEDEIARSFDELLDWIRKGHRPTAGALAAAPTRTAPAPGQTPVRPAGVP